MVLSLKLFNMLRQCYFLFFFFNDTATTEIYTLSLHDALPILAGGYRAIDSMRLEKGYRVWAADITPDETHRDRKSTRLNSSHQIISYAVFCLKKKKIGHVTHTSDNPIGAVYVYVL